QRVALARALVLEPRLLLLDEPLSALDLKTRRSVRSELRRTLMALPSATVYVTHNPMEALFFGDRIAVLESGRVTQNGVPDNLLRHPRTPYAADRECTERVLRAHRGAGPGASLRRAVSRRAGDLAAARGRSHPSCRRDA